jgi:hypothetical protein
VKYTRALDKKISTVVLSACIGLGRNRFPRGGDVGIVFCTVGKKISASLGG